MTEKQRSLYMQVVKVTQDFLGPAAERFVSRQIETHLNKAPDKLTQKDLLQLVDWLKIAIALLTDDGETVEDFSENILRLARQRPT